ncbi:membrane cofactor protein-like isoform X2 [Tiliqua scincoides]|uniref:membrane cofactor protein-like isoform X2 n=1 Tax=Tiliqua scincoides TaxID=71010 RepID=UPI0034621859
MRRLPRWSAGLPALALLVLLVPATRETGLCNRPDRIEHAELRTGELQDSYDVGTTLTYRCISGYELIRGTTPQIQCSPASQWVPEAPQFCQGRKCPSPNLENGKVVSVTDMRLGDQITFACDDGYRLIGERTARCNLKAGAVDWNNIPFCQRIPCFPPPQITNGTISGDVRDEYEYGTAVTYRCDAGYSLIGKKSLVCTVAADGQNGVWDPPPPECKVVQCPRPEIKHGSISAFMPSFPYDHSLVITCDAGYTLSAASLIKCGADSNWHPPVPTCVFGATTVTPTIPSGDGTAPASTKPPESTPGSSNVLGIAIGCLIGLLILVAVIVLILRYRGHRTQGKTDTGTSPPDSYRVVPQNIDMALEEKKEPAQV